MMRKLILAFLLSLGMSGGAGTLLADTIHLKDGRTIEAPILNDAETYIEVERDGASVLYDREEIRKIEWSGEGIHADKEHGGKEHGGKEHGGTEHGGQEHGGKEHTSKMDDSDSAGRATLRVEGTSPIAGEGTGTVQMVEEDGAWKVAKEDWQYSRKTRAKATKRGYQLFGNRAKGLESVSGTVRLFKQPEEKGYLRIQFTNQVGLGYFGINIEDQNIVRGRASYQIDGVAPGDYKATAWYVVSSPEDALNIHSTWKNVVVHSGEGNRIDFVCDQRY